MDRLGAMALFVAVAEARSFSAAASALGLGKSAASKRIGRLEDRLGVRLINRTTRHFSLTEEGQDYLERCRRILADAEEAENAVARAHAEPCGLLKVNAPVSFGTGHLGPLLPEFLARHPRLAVELTLNDRFVDLVEEGLDVAIRIGEPRDSALIARKLGTTARVVCAAPSYLAVHGMPARPQDLASHNGLAYAYAAQPHEWRLKGPEGWVTVKVTGNLSSNNGDILRHAALAGAGIVLMPTFLVAEDLRAKRLTRVLPAWSDPRPEIHALYPPGRHLSARVRAFVDFLAETFGPHSAWES